MIRIQKRRILALLMALIMILPIVPTADLTVYAVGTDDGYDGWYANFSIYCNIFVLAPDAREVKDYSNATWTNSMTYSVDDYMGNTDNLTDEEYYALLDSFYSLKMVVIDSFVSTEDHGALWYKVEAASGYTLPAEIASNPWIFAYFSGWEGEEEYNNLILTKQAEVSATVNGQSVSVSGELPEGATVNVEAPTVNGETLENVFDIKVYDKFGYEWQPCDNGKTVTISIPVSGVADGKYVDVYHFIDHADDIDGDEEIISTEGADSNTLTPFQSALDAYGDGIHVAVEISTNVIVSNGVASIETDSFSVYNPQYDDQGDELVVKFETNESGGADPSNEKTYYVTADEKVQFIFYIDTFQKQRGTFSVTTLVGETNLGPLETETSGTIFNWQESTTVDFTGAKVGELFQIDWVKGSTGTKQPRWTRVLIVGEYNTTFNANGGTFSGGNSTLTQKIISYQPVNVVAEPTRAGYIFQGWCTVQDGSSGTTYLPSGNFPATLVEGGTLYAQWVPAQYTVNYILPDGVSNGDLFTNQTKYHDVPLVLSANKPEDIDTNTKFQYWIGSDGKRYNPGDTYETEADLTLVGVWDDAMYAVIYDANGGTNAPATQYLDTSVDSSGKITLSSGIPTRQGYAFTGWKDESGTSYTGGSTISLSDNLTLYAQWEAIAYSIVFNGNGSNGGSTAGISNLYYETSYANLTANGFTKNNYKFQGWALTASSNIVQYTNGQNVKVSELVDSASATQGQLSDGKTITLYAVWADAIYTIQYKSADTDTNVSITNLSQTVICSSASQTTINSSANRSRYTFAGWSDSNGTIYKHGDPVPVGEDGDVITLTATWKPNVVGYIYTMENGSPVQKGSVKVGEEEPASMVMLPSEVGSSVPNMTFIPDEGYKIVEVLVENSAIEYTLNADGSYTYPGFVCDAPRYIAVKTEPCYTITWLDGFGAILKTEELPFGATVTAPADPTKAGYTFAGWSPEVPATMPAENVTVTAQWTGNKYTIKFVNEDGTVLQSSEVTCGEIPVYTGETPTKAATAQYTYTFAGWTPAVSAVTGEATYTATYTATINKYTITWVNYNNELLGTTEVEYGSTPTYSGTPVRTNNAQYTYTFSGWTPEVVPVTGAATYKATYTETVNCYNVTWKNWNGETLERDLSIPYGTTPSYDGAEPTKPTTQAESYTFKGWSPTIAPVTGDIEYVATFTPVDQYYTITWKDGDGNVLKTENVKYGAMPDYIGNTPTKTATAEYSYTFNGTWFPAIEAVNGAVTYTAQFDSAVNKYTVTWNNDDGTTLHTESLAYGSLPKYEGVPTKEGTLQHTYTFAGWNPAVVAVTGDVTYTATYTSTANKYTITFVNEDGTVLQSSEVPCGEIPVYTGSTPTKESTAQYSYTFKSWDVEPTAVTGAATYTATYTSTVNKYTIKFVNEDGTVLQSGEVEYGQIPSYSGETPQKASSAENDFTFVGWNPEISSVVAEKTYTAQFTSIPREYKVIYHLTTKDYLKDAATTEFSWRLKVGSEIDWSIFDGYNQRGYEFSGWTGDYKQFVNMPARDLNIYGTLTENTATINYFIVDPNGNLYASNQTCGALTVYSVTVGCVTGTVQGSEATTYDSTYKFVGWFTNAECTGDPISTEKAYKPQKNGEGLYVAAVYYAKFDYNLTTLTINCYTGYLDGSSNFKQHSYEEIDPNQRFLFNITGAADGVDLTVAVAPNASVVIDGLTVGCTYTVTMIDEWSWRYAFHNVSIPVGSSIIETSFVREFASVTFKLDVSGKISVNIVRTEEKWLDGDSYRKIK